MVSVQLIKWLVCFSFSASQSATAQVVRCVLEVKEVEDLIRFDPKTIFLGSDYNHPPFCYQYPIYSLVIEESLPV
jgi:hypothetical protein